MFWVPIPSALSDTKPQVTSATEEVQNHERPAGRAPAKVKRYDQRGKGSGDGAVPFETVDQAFAHLSAPVMARLPNG